MQTTTARLMGVLALAAAIAGPAQAGEILRKDAASPFTWQSTECVRPAKPYFREDDTMRQAKLAQYAAKIERYIDCMKREAQRDFDRTQLEMQRAVQDSLQTEVDRLNDEMERTVYDTR